MSTLVGWYHYFFPSTLEFWAFVTSLVGVWLMTKQWLVAWPAGLVSVLLYAWFFMSGGLYADATLQIFFFGMLCYGWWHWMHPRPGAVELPVTRTSKAEWVHYGLLTLGLFLVIFLLNTVLKIWMSGIPLGESFAAFFRMNHALIKSASAPFITFLDSATTAISLTAQWMQARKKLENWTVWIIVDIAYVFLYLYKEYNATAILSVLYCGLAVMGYLQWKRARPSAEAGT